MSEENELEVIQITDPPIFEAISIKLKSEFALRKLGRRCL